MTDQDLEGAITQALGLANHRALEALTSLQGRLQAERPPGDPALGRLWDALVVAAKRSPDDVELLLTYAEQRARWLVAANGPGDPATIEAWLDLGESAELEYAWDLAGRAWEAIAGAPDSADPSRASSLSRALRGLGARRLADQRLAEARQLFERDLALREAAAPSDPAQVALSLDSLAVVLEQLGDRAGALAQRKRQREQLVAADATASQLKIVDERIELLTASH